MWDGLDAMSGNTPHWLRGERYQHFGARAYDPVTCVFMQIDPMAEKYYGLTPYHYCAGNPVMYIDPQGNDVWDVDKDGKISKVKTTKSDIVRSVDENGDVLHKIRLGRSSTKLESFIIGDQTYQYFSLSNAKQAQKLFEFLSMPSTWNFPNDTSDGSIIKECAAVYTNIGNAVLIGDKGRAPTNMLALMYIKSGAIFSHIDHVHPNSDSEPSGTGKDNKQGDIYTIQFLRQRGIKFEGNIESYRIFTPKDRKYYPYDEYSTLSISASVVTEKRIKKHRK